MTRRLPRTALLLAGLVGLSACGPEAGVVLAGAGLASFIHTDKTLTDHAASLATGKDCAVLHAVRHESYCQAPPGADRRLAEQAATLYCYRTLGGVACYDRPDYGASSQTWLNYAHGYAPAPSGPAEPAPAPLAVLPSAGLE